MIKVKTVDTLTYFANAEYAAEAMRLSIEEVGDTMAAHYNTPFRELPFKFLAMADYVIDTKNDRLIKNRSAVDMETLLDMYLEANCSG